MLLLSLAAGAGIVDALMARAWGAVVVIPPLAIVCAVALLALRD